MPSNRRRRLQQLDAFFRVLSDRFPPENFLFLSKIENIPGKHYNAQL